MNPLFQDILTMHGMPPAQTPTLYSSCCGTEITGSGIDIAAANDGLTTCPDCKEPCTAVPEDCTWEVDERDNGNTAWCIIHDNAHIDEPGLRPELEDVR